MNIIIPMAGMGKRLRPHTLTTPKPLLPVAGKPIVHRLVEDIAKVCNSKIDQIGFIVGHFGNEVEAELLKIAASVGAQGKIFYQEEPLGTAHAVMCAEELLHGNVTVAFADTLFKADFKLDISKEAIIWVQKVDDPSAFGVVKVNEQGIITDFVEKPKTPVSDLAIIGIYYFKNGDQLKSEINHIITNNLKDSGEYQLTRALENLKQNGVKFSPGKVTEWLDCGNKNATVNTNKRYLEYIKDEKLVADTAINENSVIIPPVFIGQNVQLYNTIVGPHVSIGDNTIIRNSRVQNSIIQKGCTIEKANLENSMLGSFVTYSGKSTDLSIGDYSSLAE